MVLDCFDLKSTTIVGNAWEIKVIAQDAMGSRVG